MNGKIQVLTKLAKVAKIIHDDNSKCNIRKK